MSASTNRESTRRYKGVNAGEVAMPICIAGVDGNDLVDVEGNRYLDFSSGSGVVNAGWQREEVLQVLHDQAGRLSYCPPGFPPKKRSRSRSC